MYKWNWFLFSHRRTETDHEGVIVILLEFNITGTLSKCMKSVSTHPLLVNITHIPE